ncbi:MAG: DNA polymerase III subunit beta [Nitrospirae bacterium]|nr:DNA polymerase III subunit beta [Nitrospirota bacterium]
MKLSVAKDELQEKLSNIQNIVEKRNTMPILSHFLLEAGGKGTHIVATDLQIAIREPLAATLQSEGKLCIPARKLFEIVREADGEITLEAEDEQWVKVSFGKSRFRLACLSPGEFPAWPGVEKTDEVRFGIEALSEMIEKTIYAAGETDTRYTLNGLLFHIRPGDENITVVGTDGHRLALLRKSLGTKAAEEKKVIVPRKAASELRRFFGGAESVSAIIGKNHILFTIGDVQFLVRLIEGTYPNYEQVLPPSNQKRITIGREDFLKTLRRVSIMSRERSNAVRVDVTDNSLAVSSSNPDIGEARDEISVEYKGDDISAGFNARYLMDALGAMTSERVVFAMQDPLSPTLLQEEGREEYKCVVMPMRI